MGNLFRPWSTGPQGRQAARSHLKSPLSSELFDCGGGLEGAPGAGRGAAFSAAKAAEHTEPRNNASTTKGMLGHASQLLPS